MLLCILTTHQEKDKLHILEAGPTHLGVAIALDAMDPLRLCSSMGLETAVETCKCNRGSWRVAQAIPAAATWV